MNVEGKSHFLSIICEFSAKKQRITINVAKPVVSVNIFLKF